MYISFMRKKMKRKPIKNEGNKKRRKGMKKKKWRARNWRTGWGGGRKKNVFKHALGVSDT